MNKKEYSKVFIARIRKTREQADYSPSKVAKFLGITEAAYNKYETRSVMPHYLIERFSIITRADIAYLLTGEAKAEPGDNNVNHSRNEAVS